jgi:hypothetical protein
LPQVQVMVADDPEPLGPAAVVAYYSQKEKLPLDCRYPTRGYTASLANPAYEPDVAHQLRWRSARGEQPDDSLGMESIEKGGRVAARCHEGAVLWPWRKGLCFGDRMFSLLDKRYKKV